MRFISECFGEHGSTFTRALKNVGFSTSQADAFLKEAATCLLTAKEYSGTTRAITDLISTNPARILHSIDVNFLAQKVGITADLAKAGLSAIRPLLSDIMSRKKDGIVDAIISLAWHPNGRLTDAAKQIFY